MADDYAGSAPHIPALDGDGLLLKVVTAMRSTLSTGPFPLDSFSGGRRSDHGSGSR